MTKHKIPVADRKAVTKLITRYEALEALASNEDVEVAKAVMIDASKTAKDLDTNKLAVTKPLRDEVAEINKMYKDLCAPLLEIKNEVKKGLDVYLDELERQRNAAAAHQEVEFDDEDTPSVPSGATNVEAAPDISAQSYLVPDEIDITKLPVEYMTPDYPKIRAATKLGIIISGVTTKMHRSIAAR
jgi:hypothetical protein